MQKNTTTNHYKGFTIIEIILGIAMITVFLVSNSYYYKKLLDASQETTRNIQSGFLLEEGIEVAKLMRDTSWSANIAPLTLGAQYYFRWTGTAWEATTTPQIVETVFTRTFSASAVNRDGTDNIVTSGGVVDSGTKKIRVDVSWISKGNRATSTKSVETYITNLFSN